MRLFLSSYRFGGHEDAFIALCGTPGPIAVIANAADSWPAAARAGAVTSEMTPLRRAGFEPTEVDLRHFVHGSGDVAEALAGFPAVWIRGGNTFVLRAQLSRSGADAVIVDRVRADSLVYAGYSAGACVASTSLAGVEYSDDPGEVRAAAGIAAIWTGLALVDFAVVPHVNSILDESDSAARTIARYESESVSYRSLTDDQAVVVDGNTVTTV